MKTIKGEYENGSIKLLEEAPPVKKNKVPITFLDEEETEEETVRNFSLHNTAKFFTEYLRDEKEDLYQEYLNSPE